VRVRLYAHLAAAVLSFAALTLSPESQTPDPRPQLRDEYQGKTFLVRGFYSGDSLLYDAKGILVGRGDAGDWTADGFVTVDDVYASGPRIVVESRRLLVVYTDHMFRFRAAERPDAGKDSRPVRLKMTVDFGNAIPSDEQAEAALSRIFLTAQDDFSDMVPDFWKPCVSGGLAGQEKCRFSNEVLTIPGVAPAGKSTATTAVSNDSPRMAAEKVFPIGGGISPPKWLSHTNPEFSEAARRVKFQGTATLSLVVNKDGIPKNIYIVEPLGSGLDAKAVQAVKGWEFLPAEKDGQPVAAQIMVEVDFHLY
jgi:TonB family protein